ncbi:hypothetical protein JCM8547_008821 [Rhodosporidiobolus lusitaniae]
MSPALSLPLTSPQLVLSPRDSSSLSVSLALAAEGLLVTTTGSASTRPLPFLHLLSCTLLPFSPKSSSFSRSNSDAVHLPVVRVAALVPSGSGGKKGGKEGKLKLWTVEGGVREFRQGQGEGGTLRPGRGAGAEGEREVWKRVKQWCEEVESKAYAGIPRHRRLHIIVNPAGGKGTAKRVWEDVVKPMYEAAGVQYEVSFTGPPNSPQNAFRLGRSHLPFSPSSPSSSSQPSGETGFHTLVSLSGDGILHELLNGLASQPHAADVLRRTPVVHVPCGSGNALATSLLGPEKVGDLGWAALAALKGNPIPLDLCAFTQRSSSSTSSSSPSSPTIIPLYSFLSQAFGLMADLDLGTEHLRFLGDLRFTVGYVQGALKRVRYPCCIDVLLPSGPCTKKEIAERHNRGLGETAWEEEEEGERDLPRLRLPGVREDPREEKVVKVWDRFPTQEELASLPPHSSSSDEEEERWIRLNLMDKQKGKGALFVYGGKTPFVSADLMMFPLASPSDGLIDLAIVEPMGTVEALQAMDNANLGSLLSHPRVLYLKALAYRLSFPPSGKGNGNLSVDGERVPYESFQVEVVQGVGRVMSLTGGWEGRRRVEVLEREGK